MVVCRPSVGATSNFYGYVTSLATPLKVFSVSQFSPSTTFTPSCVLTYSLYDSTGTSQISSTSLMKLDPATGEFYIMGFTNSLFEQTITIKITSTFTASSNSIFTG